MPTLTEQQFKLMQSAHALFADKDLVQQYKQRANVKVKDLCDGHHSMLELYAHRRKLSAIIFKLAGNYAWKSKLHADNTMFDHDFIVGVSIPNVGDYSYHYNLKFWDDFDVPERAHAPEYDGHTPADIDRLFSLIPLIQKLPAKKD